MELSKIRIDFKDFNEFHAQCNVQADIVLIDRTYSDKQPMVYILKKDHIFAGEELSSCSIDKDSFLQMGEMLTLNKKSKILILSNDNTITYNHLIIASGSQHELLNDEFLAGVQTLVDALRVRKKIPNSFATMTIPAENKKNLDHPHVEATESKRRIRVDKVRSKKIVKTDAENLNRLLQSSKRTYEVQV